MTVVKQLGNKIICLIKYFALYILSSTIVILVFAFVILKSGCLSPVKTSISFFWGMGIYILPDLFLIEVLEKICSDIFAVVFVGAFLADFLNPINPIIPDEHVVYNNDEYKFRFWIMLPRGRFYYNLKFRAILTNEEAFQRGENKLESKYEYTFYADILRGIHIISLGREESNALREKILQLKNKGCEWHILCIISVESENGLIYNKMVRYYDNSIYKDHIFVPTRRIEIERILNNNCGGSPFEYNAPRLEKRRYENFGKLYNLNSKQEINRNGQKFILTRKQLEKGVYRWPLSWLVEFVNIIARRVID